MIAPTASHFAPDHAGRRTAVTPWMEVAVFAVAVAVAVGSWLVVRDKGEAQRLLAPRSSRCCWS
ncbi:hypothetical protein AB5I41_05245 [Sphingomonas sp. MMS24-JH45]